MNLALRRYGCELRDNYVEPSSLLSTIYQDLEEDRILPEILTLPAGCRP